jgi:peroxiredoxin/Tfp pilus assembly protein PilF
MKLTWSDTRPRSLLLIGFACLLFECYLPATGPRVSAQGNDGTFEEELEQGKGLLRQRKYEEALKRFKRANEIQQKKCGVCFQLMAEAYFGLGAYKNVIDCADKMIELAGTDSKLVMLAHNNKGLALQSLSENKDQKKLQAAEVEFRTALAIEGSSTTLHYNLGVVLLQMSRDEEGIAELQQYTKLQPRGPNTENARKLIENPRRARENYAPEFSFTTATGEYLSLEELRGKVVVLDFWGTWCPPCVESVPSLRNLHKRYAKEPSFVLIGISSDSEEEPWRDFVDKNKMIWPQYRDRDRKIARLFDVHSFPTYVVIDHEGVVRFRSVGASWVRAANLEDAIRKQVKMVAKSVEPR